MKDAFPALGDSGPILDMFDWGPFRVPLRFVRSRAGGPFRVEVAALTATNGALTSGERTVWWWRLLTSALEIVGVETGEPAPDLSAFAPEAVSAVGDVSLLHVQLAPGWGAGSAGGKSVARWRAVAGPLVSRLDEDLRTWRTSLRSAMAEQYLWPHLAGKLVGDPAAGMPSVYRIPVAPDFHRLSEADAVRRVVADLAQWWDGIGIGEHPPLPLSSDDTTYAWQSRPRSVLSALAPSDGPSPLPDHLRRWVRLEVEETAEGTIGRLADASDSGEGWAGTTRRLALPAWVYARGLVGDWNMPGTTVELRQLNPCRTAGAAGQLELPPRT